MQKGSVVKVMVCNKKKELNAQKNREGKNE